jgi:multicomponent Na+:H+ antiporter subunit D
MTDILSPALILLVSAILIGLFRGPLRAALVLLAPIAALWAIWQVPDGVFATVSFLEYQIEPVEGSPLRRLLLAGFLHSAKPAGMNWLLLMPMQPAPSASVLPAISSHCLFTGS